MKKKLITNFILSTLILSIFISGQGIHSESNRIKSLDPNESNINLNQDDTVTSTELISDSIEILVQTKNDTGNWGFTASELDDKVYFGLAGGMAGMGLKLLESLTFDVVKNDIALFTNILDIANEIGQELNSTGYITGTNAEWNITKSDDYVDLSWDFGLAGIAAFFSELYNVTGTENYKNLALKTLTSISELANTADGLFWESQILDYINDTDWYDPLDIEFLTNYETPSFTYSGISLGTAGVAKSALSYLNRTSDSTNPVVTKMLNDSVLYLDNIANITGNERSFLMAEESTGLESTSYATGVSGIAQLYLDLYEFTGNSTYKDNTLEIVNWLNGTNIDFQYRFHTTYIINGSVDNILDKTYELGFTHGMTGVIQTLFNIGVSLTNITTLQMSEELADILYFSRTETTNDLRFPERIFGLAQDQGSTTWNFGMSGIYPTLFQLAEYLDQDDSRLRVAKMKNYMLSQTSSYNGLNGIINTNTLKIETNPSTGIPGHLEMLSLKSIGKLNVLKDESTPLDFLKVEIGNSNTMSIVLENIGEEDISVSWNETQNIDDFSSESFSTVISEREQYILNITFTPTVEAEKTPLWVIETINTQFLLQLKGIGFDLPFMGLTSSIANNTNIDSHKIIGFELNISDSSDISSVRVEFGESSDVLNVDPASDTYKTSINTGSLLNGTYIIIFTATDVLGNSNQIGFSFEVGVYTPGVVDALTSEDTLYKLIGAVVILVGVAILVTRKYMK